MANLITPSTLSIQDTTFIDLDLTFKLNPLTLDVNTTLDANAIANSIRNLVSTMNYERPFHPEIGSGVYGLLFDIVSPVTANVIEQVILKELKAFEPRAIINFIDVNAQPDSNAYAVTVNFSLSNFIQTFTVTTLLKQLR